MRSVTSVVLLNKSVGERYVDTVRNTTAAANEYIVINKGHQLQALSGIRLSNNRGRKAYCEETRVERKVAP